MKVYLKAHSMGNIVTGSALHRGLTVDNYILLQAAVPAGCYDTSSGINSYSRFTSAESTSPTPDIRAVPTGRLPVRFQLLGTIANHAFAAPSSTTSR